MSKPKFSRKPPHGFARENPLADSISDSDGVTFLVKGPIETPSGGKPGVRTVWLVETGELAPRFIQRLPFTCMIEELDCVALNVGLPEYGLTAGDMGTVVHIYKGGHDFMVEFTTFDGTTVAMAKVSAAQIRPLVRNENHHACPFALTAH